MGTYNKFAGNVALLDGQAIGGADVLAEGTLIAAAGQVWGREGGDGESENGSDELHIDSGRRSKMIYINDE